MHGLVNDRVGRCDRIESDPVRAVLIEAQRRVFTRGGIEGYRRGGDSRRAQHVKHRLRSLHVDLADLFR